MANYSFWAIGDSQISVSGGGQLSGISQGDGSHLVGLNITLNSYDFEEIDIRDGGSDVNFDDNDSNQRLRGRQFFDGDRYNNNTVVEAEYRIVLRDPDTGIEYQALAVNFNNSSPAYSTVEGLAFIEVIPPAGVALEVIAAFEGPGSSGRPPLDNIEIAVPACFTPGILIDTPSGQRPVESLRAGDLVSTYDRGPQPLIWVGQTGLGARDLARTPAARPIVIRKDALGPGVPARDMRVSPQHRILISGPQAELFYGEPEVLAAAAHLVDGHRIHVDETAQQVLYIHVQCASHEVLMSEGLPSESYNPGALSLMSSPEVLRAQLGTIMPAGIAAIGPSLDAARPMIKRHEAALWRAAA